MLNGYEKTTFSACLGTAADPNTRSDATASANTLIEHDIYSRGEPGPTIVIIQELPGIGPETLDLAARFVDNGYRVVLPHLFGPLGRISLLGNLARVFCMRREFKLLARNASSPIVDWLRALCRDLRDNKGSTAVGVIGMCLTGNFAISMMADDAVLAGVASQPSLPLNRQAELHMSADEISAVRSRLDTEGPMLALRFEGDKLCRAEKFDALERTFNDDKQRINLIELPGPGHSVLTLDFVKRAAVTEPALATVLNYFDEKLKNA